MLTSIHLMHLLVGLALLIATMLHIGKVLETGEVVNGELIGFSSCFWHMVDIVWIVLFPLLYLLH
jgi:nitric oxide reductase NorE protein